MAFCLVMGTNDFSSQLKGYEGVRAQCANCGNWQTQCQSRWPFFTVCWIPLIPLATHKYHELVCHTCRFHQDLQYRPEIQPNGQQGQPMPPYQAQPQGQNQGWNQQEPGGGAYVQQGGYK